MVEFPYFIPCSTKSALKILICKSKEGDNKNILCYIMYLGIWGNLTWPNEISKMIFEWLVNPFLFFFCFHYNMCGRQNSYRSFNEMYGYSISSTSKVISSLAITQSGENRYLSHFVSIIMLLPVMMKWFWICRDWWIPPSWAQDIPLPLWLSFWAVGYSFSWWECIVP